MKKTLPIHHASQIALSEQVVFSYSGREYAGYVCKKGRKYAYVTCEDQREYKVPYELLQKVPGAPKRQVERPEDALRLQFHVRDRVNFEVKNHSQQGIITRMNPKRAHIVCDDDSEYQVPYALLTLLASHEKQEGSGQKRNELELRRITRLARRLIRRHRLKQWNFQFDNASRRAGCCNFNKQVISLSYEYARFASDEHIEDAILHEIAHAIVGKKHNHDAVWQAKAREIGCSGERCHDLQFTPPRYIVSCENHCWVASAERRRRNRVCATCRGTLVYTTYTEERWKREQGKIREHANENYSY
ncbi:MAG: hypothetical protein GY801_24100 [bacterium]|nr:hypothetical protein [bacterium]